MRTMVWLIVTLGLASVVGAQQTPQADLTDTVRILEQQVEAQQDRVATVTAQLKATDEHIERRIARLIGYLTTVTDGKESRSKVITAKQSAYAALKKNIEFYVRQRGQRFEQLYQPASLATKEAIAADVLRLNTRIEKRVEQALALVTSLPAEQDMQKYQTYYDGDDWYQRVDSAYAHQQRIMTYAGQWRDQVFADLKASIDRLQRSRAELERALAYAKTAEGKKFVQDLLDRNEELVAKRREQIQAALGKYNPQARPLGKQAADALLQQIQEEKTNNAKDNGEWIRLMNERDAVRARLFALQDQLAYYQRLAQSAAPRPAP